MSKVTPDLSSVTVVGLDLAKSVFQVHCVDAGGKVLLNRALKRREVMGVSVTRVSVTGFGDVSVTTFR